MTQDTAVVPREGIDRIVPQLERVMDDARDRWSIPKGADQVRSASWHNREIAYRQRLHLLAVAALADPRYATHEGS